MVKQLPNSGTLRRLTVPPWAWQMDLTIARPKPGAMFAPVRRHAIEALEYLVVVIGIDADAVIFDRDETAVIACARLHGNPSTRLACI